MKTLDVLTKQDMMKEYKLTLNFLRVHGKAMGAFGKPRLWARDVVERYLRDLAEAEERNRKARAEASHAARAFIAASVRRVQAVPQTGPGEIQGRGGRKAVGGIQ